MRINKGISLIVLVITIIVMIILAGSIILTLSNNGIINKASNATEEMDKATLEEIASLGWADTYAKYGATKELTGEALLDALKQGIKDSLKENGLKPEEYGITVTEKGFKIAKGWLQDGLIVTKGDKQIEIGTTINYEDGVAGYTGGWKLLGANDKGELLIMSTTNVTTYRLGYEDSMTDAAVKLKESQNDWLTAKSQLDAVCAQFGNGEGATGARSITIEDVNKITGYKPNVSLFERGKIQQYGNVVKYSYNGSEYPTYTGSNGVDGKLGESLAESLGVSYSKGFYHYNGEKFITIKDIMTGENGKVFATAKSTAYLYEATTLADYVNEDDDYSSEEKKGLAEDTAAYKMLFGDSNKYLSYMLATNYCYTHEGYVSYGTQYVYQGKVTGERIWRSYGEAFYVKRGVRAVVSLGADVEI